MFRFGGHGGLRACMHGYAEVWKCVRGVEV